MVGGDAVALISENTSNADNTRVNTATERGGTIMHGEHFDDLCTDKLHAVEINTQLKYPTYRPLGVRPSTSEVISLLKSLDESTTSYRISNLLSSTYHNI